MKQIIIYNPTTELEEAKFLVPNFMVSSFKKWLKERRMSAYGLKKIKNKK